MSECKQMQFENNHQLKVVQIDAKNTDSTSDGSSDNKATAETETARHASTRDIKAICDKRDPCKREIKGLVIRQKPLQTPLDSNQSSLERHGGGLNRVRGEGDVACVV